MKMKVMYEYLRLTNKIKNKKIFELYTRNQ